MLIFKIYVKNKKNKCFKHVDFIDLKCVLMFIKIIVV